MGTPGPATFSVGLGWGTVGGSGMGTPGPATAQHTPPMSVMASTIWRNLKTREVISCSLLRKGFCTKRVTDMQGIHHKSNQTSKLLGFDFSLCGAQCVGEPCQWLAIDPPWRLSRELWILHHQSDRADGIPRPCRSEVRAAGSTTVLQMVTFLKTLVP